LIIVLLIACKQYLLQKKILISFKLWSSGEYKPSLKIWNAKSKELQDAMNEARQIVIPMVEKKPYRIDRLLARAMELNETQVTVKDEVTVSEVPPRVLMDPSSEEE
jgi:hypothetical protein